MLLRGRTRGSWALLSAVEILHSDVHIEFAPKHTRRELAGMRCVDCSWKCRAFHLSKVEVGLYSTRRHVRLHPGGVVPSVWLERQIARCEGVAMIGMHACSRMAENRSSSTLHTMPAPCLFLPACQMPSRCATAIRRLSQRDDVLPCSQKRRLRAERPHHCRVISPAYPVGRRGALGRLRHMSRILC